MMSKQLVSRPTEVFPYGSPPSFSMQQRPLHSIGSSSIKPDNLYCLAGLATSAAEAHQLADSPAYSRYRNNFYTPPYYRHSATNSGLALPFVYPSFPPPSFPSPSFSPPSFPPSLPRAVIPRARAVIPSPVLPAPPSSNDRITVSLAADNQWLWQQFYSVGTEMIITNAGRRMFPAVKISVAGLELDSRYKMKLEVQSVDQHRYKYTNSSWMKTLKLDTELPGTVSDSSSWTHPESPKLGSFWMKNTINFQRAKLTNNSDPTPASGYIVLQSMHKYVPRINILMETPAGSNVYTSVFVETLHLCEFVTVTAYQSKMIAQLKIDNNPHAKAFRVPADESEGHEKVLTPRYSVTTPAFPMATRPCNLMNLFPYATGYLGSPPFSGHVPNYYHFPYHGPVISPQPFMASSSVSSASFPRPPFQHTQQWWRIPPSSVGGAEASHPRMSPPMYQSSLPESAAKKVCVRQAQVDSVNPDDTSKEFDQES